MSKLLFIADGHNGPIIPASSPSGFTLYGDQAPLLRRGIQDFAETQSIVTILDGGDENTFEENGEDFSDFRRSTKTIMAEFDGVYYVLNANHTVDGKTGQFYNKRETELITELDGFEDTSLLLIQPHYVWNPGPSHFRVDENKVLTALDHVETKNLIIAFHWPLEKSGKTVNTSGRKSPSLQGDLTPIQEKIERTAAEGVDVLSLSGHSHCFAFSKSNGVRSLTMPSFVQHDVDYTDEPCGLSALIEEGRNGLGISFRKTVVNPGIPIFVSPAKLTQQTDEVSLDYMDRYKRRPFIPPTRQRL